MPKIKLSETVEYREMLRANIFAVMGILRVDINGLAKILNVSHMTVRERIKNPGRLTSDEIYIICKASKVEPSAFISKRLTLV